MKLRNNVKIKGINTPIIVSYAFLGSIVLGIFALIYFNFQGSSTYANDNKPNRQAELNGSVFRILQNGKPIDPIMGIAINSEGIFEVQVKMGVELKKVKTMPIAAEVSILRGQEKVNTVKFTSVTDLKANNLHEWINENYKPKDKLAIELLNTVLEKNDAIKVYSLASVY